MNDEGVAFPHRRASGCRLARWMTTAQFLRTPGKPAASCLSCGTKSVEPDSGSPSASQARRSSICRRLASSTTPSNSITPIWDAQNNLTLSRHAGHRRCPAISHLRRIHDSMEPQGGENPGRAMPPRSSPVEEGRLVGRASPGIMKPPGGMASDMQRGGRDQPSPCNNEHGICTAV